MQQGYAPEGGKRITAQQFRRICYPPAWSMRIYYPTNDEEPTPALPKGGSRHPPPTPPQGRGARDKHLHVQADMLSACIEYEDILSD